MIDYHSVIFSFRDKFCQLRFRSKLRKYKKAKAWLFRLFGSKILQLVHENMLYDVSEQTPQIISL